MNIKIYQNILKVVLLSAAIGWGISAVGIFLPWSVARNQLYSLGCDIPNDPMLNYWFRMTACGFTFIACQFVYMAINLQNKIKLICFAGYFQVFLGIILFGYGIMLDLFFIPYLIDSCFCLFVGLALIISCYKMKEN